jgi:hypothetical protein
MISQGDLWWPMMLQMTMGVTKKGSAEAPKVPITRPTA